MPKICNLHMYCTIQKYVLVIKRHRESAFGAKVKTVCIIMLWTHTKDLKCVHLDFSYKVIAHFCIEDSSTVLYLQN